MTDTTNADSDHSDISARPVPLNDAERVISAFGGVRPMASRLGVAATTVQGWKSRGHIPDNRRAAVLEAAEANGIDLATAAEELPDDAGRPEKDAREKETVEPVAAEPAVTQAVVPGSARRGSSGLAWIAAVLAVLALVAVLTQPRWSPLLYGVRPAPVPTALEDRIVALESQPKAPDLSARVSALERGLTDLRNRAPVAATPDLTPQLDAVSARVEALRRALETADQEERTENERAAAEIAALRSAVEALAARQAESADQTRATNARGTGLVLAIGALEEALGAGAPYADLLATVSRLAGLDDPALAEPLAVLAPHADAGVPTRAQLARRLDALAAVRGVPLWTPDSESWTDRLLRRIDSVVTIRRLDDDRGDATGLARAATALAKGGLPEAIAALSAAVGPGRAWARDAGNRLAAEKAMQALRLRAVERLGEPAAAKDAPR